MHYTIIKVFSLADGTGGNPCAIVDYAIEINPSMMQSIATTLNLPETIFLIQEADGYRLRFFATKAELPLCCHGTLGGAFYLIDKKNIANLSTLKTNTKLIKIQLKESLVSMSVEKGEIIDTNCNAAELAKLLDIEIEDLHPHLPCVIASVGSPKLLLPIKNRKALFALKPNSEKLAAWSKTNRVNGLYAYTDDTLNQHADYVARNFNPLFSNEEDVATGVAAAALAQTMHLINAPNKRNYLIEQGHNLNNPSEIFISMEGREISIKGRAFFVENCTLNFSKL